LPVGLRPSQKQPIGVERSGEKIHERSLIYADPMPERKRAIMMLKDFESMPFKQAFGREAWKNRRVGTFIKKQPEAVKVLDISARFK
jgi:hypothetical protein